MVARHISLARVPAAALLALLLFAAGGSAPVGAAGFTVNSTTDAGSRPAPAADGEDTSATGDLDITDDLTITGAGEAVTIIDGGRLDRVFDVIGGTVEISAATIRNGYVSIDDDQRLHRQQQP